MVAQRYWGERSISSSSSMSHLKNWCRHFCLFTAVEAERVSMIPAWKASMSAVVFSAASSASGECSAT